MSMSLFVVLALGAEPNTDELNLYSKENGHNIQYIENVVLKEYSGFLPAKIKSQEAGTELYSFPVSDIPEPFKPIVPPKYSEGIVYQLRFGGNPIEAQTAFTTAIILSSKYNGVVIEDQAGSLMSLEQLTQSISYFGGM